MKTSNADALDDITIARPERSTAPVVMTTSALKGPGVIFCPNPRMPLWSHHPRVFIDLAAHGEGSCPYCGTRYVLAGGAPPRGH